MTWWQSATPSFLSPPKPAGIATEVGPRLACAGDVESGTTTIEKWTYNRGSQSFDMVVTIVDRAIKSIDRKE